VKDSPLDSCLFWGFDSNPLFWMGGWGLCDDDPLSPCTRTEQLDDDDEVLLVLAEELEHFVELVGGPDHAVCLVEPLGVLAAVEETVVREQVWLALSIACRRVCAGPCTAFVTLHSS
jgi:hypothetical protein